MGTRPHQRLANGRIVVERKKPDDVRHDTASPASRTAARRGSPTSSSLRTDTPIAATPIREEGHVALERPVHGRDLAHREPRHAHRMFPAEWLV
jgi:hypothetical protein